METLISLLIIAAVVAIAIWIINLIPFPPGLQIIKTIVIGIVAVMALIQVIGFLR
jgi:hypothetical protein